LMSLTILGTLCYFLLWFYAKTPSVRLTIVAIWSMGYFLNWFVGSLMSPMPAVAFVIFWVLYGGLAAVIMKPRDPTMVEEGIADARTSARPRSETQKMMDVIHAIDRHDRPKPVSSSRGFKSTSSQETTKSRKAFGQQTRKYTP